MYFINLPVSKFANFSKGGGHKDREGSVPTNRTCGLCDWHILIYIHVHICKYIIAVISVCSWSLHVQFLRLFL